MWINGKVRKEAEGEERRRECRGKESDFGREKEGEGEEIMGCREGYRGRKTGRIILSKIRD